MTTALNESDQPENLKKLKELNEKVLKKFDGSKYEKIEYMMDFGSCAVMINVSKN